MILGRTHQYKSPCIGCEREHKDKDLCSEKCPRRIEWLQKHGLWDPREVEQLEDVFMTDILSKTTDDLSREDEGFAIDTDGSAIEIRICKAEGCLNEAKISGYCHQCFSKIGAKASARNGLRKKPKKNRKRNPQIKRLVPIRKALPGHREETVISVDFEGFEDVLNRVKELAEEEVEAAKSSNYLDD